LVCADDWVCFEFYSFPHFDLVPSERKYVSAQDPHLYWVGRINHARPNLLSRQINYLYYSTSRRSMSRFTVKDLERRFIKYANSDEFPETAVQWHEYDGKVRIVFIWVEGEWSPEIRQKMTTYLREKFHKKLLISRMVRTTPEENHEDDEDYI